MTTQTDHLPVADRLGQPLFHCQACGSPMLHADFFDQSLRLPDAGESASDYCDAELIDAFRHTDCERAALSA